MCVLMMNMGGICDKYGRYYWWIGLVFMMNMTNLVGIYFEYEDITCTYIDYIDKFRPICVIDITCKTVYHGSKFS